MNTLCRNRERKCAAASKYISCSLRNVWLLLSVFQCFLKNVRLLLKGINERLLLKEIVQPIILCVWLLLETFQCFLINVRLLLKDINERLLLKENLELIFFCVWLLLETFQCFFNEHAAPSERYQWTTASDRKNVLLRITSTSENILKWNQFKIKMMETYSLPQKPAIFMQ